ncbi:MAG: cellulase [Saccharolobus sp.]
MRKVLFSGIILVIIIVLIVLSLSLSTFLKSPVEKNNVTNQVRLFQSNTKDFSLIGSYLSDSLYAMADIYGNNVSLVASPFLWNIKESNGQVVMNFSDYLFVDVNMTSIKKINPSITVDGYPGLMYGREFWFPFETQTETYELNLPQIVKDLPSFYSVLNYSVFQNKGTIDDFSYDIWLSKNPNITTLQYGDFEVMIWLYWHENLSANKYFIYVGNMTIPVLINGSEVPLNFSVYILPRTGSANGWTGVYFLSPKNLQGSIGVPIGYILNNMGTYLVKAKVNIYNTSTYYLDAIQVGMEFNDNNGTANLGYSLYSWYLTFNSTLDALYT